MLGAGKSLATSWTGPRARCCLEGGAPEDTAIAKAMGCGRTWCVGTASSHAEAEEL